MGLRTKGAISSFVQSGNFESLTLTGFEPATLRIAVGHLTHYTKFPYENFLRKFQTRFYNLSAAVSPVGSSSNRRFRLKSRKLSYWLYGDTMPKMAKIHTTVECMSPLIYYSILEWAHLFVVPQIIFIHKRVHCTVVMIGRNGISLAASFI